MRQDKIVEAIHEIRKRHAETFNHDLKAIFLDLRKRQAKSGQKVVNLSRSKVSATRWNGQV